MEIFIEGKKNERATKNHRKKITELILQHFDNESIGQLLNKAPLKQGISILPAGASNTSRNKAIQNLLAGKNLKYVIHILESGQFNSFIQRNYENENFEGSVDGFIAQLKEEDGFGLDYLLHLIATEKIESVVQLFQGSVDEVKQLSEFLENEEFSKFKFQRQQEPDSLSGDIVNNELQAQIKKLQNEKQNLQKNGS